MGGAVIEEKSISHAQYMDLAYSQSETLYDLIPKSPCPITDPTNPPADTPVDGVVGSIQPSSAAKNTKQPNASTVTPSTPTFSTEAKFYSKHTNTWQ